MAATTTTTTTTPSKDSAAIEEFLKQVHSLPRRPLSERALERRSWPKFGYNENTRPPFVGTRDEVHILPPLPRQAVVPDKPDFPCEVCGEMDDHWTSTCPYYELAAEIFDSLTTGAPWSGPNNRASYVGAWQAAEIWHYIGKDPVSVRKRLAKSLSSCVKRRGSAEMGRLIGRLIGENSVFVGNLPEKTKRSDLDGLFRAFGELTSLFIAIGRRCHGFGFVNFARKEDAEKVIQELNGYSYGDKILRVGWATPCRNQGTDMESDHHSARVVMEKHL